MFIGSHSRQETTIYNTPESNQYHTVEKAIDDKSSTEQHESQNSLLAPMSAMGYSFALAISILISVISTGFITHYFLKNNYEGCLSSKDIPDLKMKIMRRPHDCESHFDNGALVDGIYRIYPNKTTPFHVYCDMTNGGWTVLQRRTNGNEDFDKDWLNYVEGFGNLSGDHWMGLKYQHLLTDYDEQYQIAFDFQLTEAKLSGTAVHDNFLVGDEDSNYTLSISPSVKYNDEMKKYVDQRGIFFYYNGAPFTTRDKDNDMREEGSCVEMTKCGGYWYKNCHVMCVNGKFDSMYFLGKAYVPTFFSKSLIKIRARF